MQYQLITEWHQIQYKCWPIPLGQAMPLPYWMNTNWSCMSHGRGPHYRWSPCWGAGPSDRGPPSGLLWRPQTTLRVTMETRLLWRPDYKLTLHVTRKRSTLQVKSMLSSRAMRPRTTLSVFSLGRTRPPSWSSSAALLSESEPFSPFVGHLA